MAWDPCGLSKINAFVLARTGIIYKIILLVNTYMK